MAVDHGKDRQGNQVGNAIKLDVCANPPPECTSLCISDPAHPDAPQGRQESRHAL